MKKKILFTCLHLFTTISLISQVPTVEREALIALYNATDGPNWVINTNWNTAQTVDNWSGVTVTNGRVTGITQSFNNLTGTLPTELQNLSELTNLNIGFNNLSGTFPDLTGLSNLETLIIGQNNFQFGDIENEWVFYVDNITNFLCCPFKNVGDVIAIDLVIGDDYLLQMPEISGTGVTYQWFKNGEELVGETNIDLNISNAQVSDLGNYVCVASSPIVTATISSELIGIFGDIPQNQIDALIDLYNDTNGPNWTNNNNWDTPEPVYTWENVFVQGDKIIELNLVNNNLNGTLPVSIGNLIDLQLLNIANNQISGAIPSEIGNLTELQTLFISDNLLNGSLPSTMWNLNNLVTLNASNNQFTGELPNEISNLEDLRGFFIRNNSITGELDLSNNSSIVFCDVSSNDLSQLRINNGNNVNFFSFNALNNPNLTCIFVDDIVYSTENWTDVDPTSTFVETDAECNVLNVDNVTLTSKFLIYPNPTNNSINILNNSNIDVRQITITNILGQIVKKAQSENYIDLSNLPNGTYLLKINLNNGSSINYKIVKR